jgi:proliferating cell nuclear antigen
LTRDQANGKKKPAKKAKKSKKNEDDDDDDDTSGPSGVVIELNSHVSLTFSLKYLVNFAKSTSISNKVQLMLSGDVPLLVKYFFFDSPGLALNGVTGLVRFQAGTYSVLFGAQDWG